MNLKSNKFLNKKILIQIYFVLFIFLNIIDFLNIIQGDLDFFKKILSWLIIGYIFYKVSLSHIFIGKKLKTYDLALILSFCLFTIPKALVIYVTNISTRTGIPDTYIIFNSFLTWINSFIFEQITAISVKGVELFLGITFLLAIILTIIISISLLLNHNYQKKSFLGSFNFQESYFKYIYEQLLLTFFLIFFGLIIFNFFMEWFALAVDSLILVIGLIYYIFLYIHNHGKGKTSSILQNISNAGNNFYLELIEMFSNKKTIFIGISFLLTLHLLVDIGVYLVPYSIGTQNTLYFDSLNIAGRDHTPLFNLINISNSQIYTDISNSTNIDGFITLGLVLAYIITLLGLGTIMFLPFYIFYKNSQHKTVKIKNFMAIFLLSSLTFILTFKLLLFFNIFSAQVNLPISIDSPANGANVRGVDIHTHNVFNQENVSTSAFMQFLVSILIFLISLIFLLFRYNKYKYFFNKTIYILVLLFFIYYIFIFYTSTVGYEINSIKSQIGIGSNYSKSVNNYQNALQIYQNDQYFKFPTPAQFENDAKTLKAQVYIFSDLKQATQRSVYYAESHKDYLLFDVIYYNKSTKIEFSDFDNVYLEKNIYNLYSKEFSEDKFKFIYFLGENKFSLTPINEETYTVNLNMKEDSIDSLFTSTKWYNALLMEITKYIEYVRLFFASVFYILGLLAFTYYFTKKNISN